jgi:hypothetical protein
LILLARSENKVRNVIDRIKEISPSTQPSFVSIELDDFDSARKAAATILSLTGKINVESSRSPAKNLPWMPMFLFGYS